MASEEHQILVIDELAHPAMGVGLALARARLRRQPRALPPILALVHHLRCSEPAAPATRRFASLVERAALAGVDAVVCTSVTTSASVRQLVGRGTQVEVVRPGRELAEVEAGTADPAPLRECTSPRLRALTVGHWTPRKGIIDAVRAVALASEEVGLDLVGETDHDPSYARLVWAEIDRLGLADRVRVHGCVPVGRLVELYRGSDALLLASWHEGYGMVLAEAMIAGLPIVATRVGAVPEVVRHGMEAELVPVGDVAALARALDRLVRDPGERRRRSRSALERAASLPTWEESCTRFAALLDGLLAPSEDPSRDRL